MIKDHRDNKDFGLTNDGREQFPVKLYAMLELAEVQDVGSIAVTWLSHGRAFKIHDEREFMEVAVPMFFNQTKIRSFYRQLNVWGYSRVSKGADAGAWYSDFFLRGAPEEMKKMVRIKIKGKGKLNHLDDQKDPDFFSMPPLPIITKSAMTGRILGNRIGPGRSSLDTLETTSIPQLFNGNQSPNLEKLNSPNPETNLSRSGSSPCSIVPLMAPSPPNLWNGYEIYQTGVPSTIRVKHDTYAPMRNFSYPSSGGMYQQISPGGISTMFSTDNEIRSSFTAGLKPLPFRVSSPMLPTDNEVKSRLIAGLEPLPFDDEVPTDEFANYIDDMIQVLSVD